MIRTRFAPSPTGYLHIGGARTALFSWAYARQRGGKFILRVEDTDLERSTQQSVQAILDGMQWLGLDCDEGPFFQMERVERYRALAEQLVNEGKAYRCYCSKEELEQMLEPAHRGVQAVVVVEHVQRRAVFPGEAHAVLERHDLVAPAVHDLDRAVDDARPQRR